MDIFNSSCEGSVAGSECSNDEYAEEVICVVIPMYRVEPYIQNVITCIPGWVKYIIAVDDASTDNSAGVVAQIDDPRIILIRNELNLGVGGAMLAGYNRAVELGATVIVKMDGDGKMDPDYLPDLLRPIIEGRADYTKGNRFADNQMLYSMPFIRRMGNLGLSFLLKLASGYWKIFDPTNGYTAVDALVFQKIDQTKIHHRYFFESSLLIELNLLGAVMVDVMIPASYKGETSSLSISRALWEFPKLILQGFLRRLWLQYFVLDFSPGSLFLVVGSLLMLFGTVWGGVKWIHSIQVGVAATTGTVMIAVLPFILGFQLLLQAINFDLQRSPTEPKSRRAARRQARYRMASV